MPEDGLRPPPVQWFSADHLPAPHRMEIWREVFGREVVQLDMTPLGDDPFRYEAAFRVVGDVSIGAGTVSSLACERTPTLVRDGNDDILILIPLRGHLRITQRGHDFDLRDGEALVRRSEDPGLTRTTQGQFLTVTIPEAQLSRRLADADRLTISVIPARAEGLTLLRHYAMMMLSDHGGMLDGAMSDQLAAGHLADLASLVLGARRDAWQLADARGGDAARLLRIESEIARNAARPDYDLQQLARAMALSPGHVRKILARTKRSFSKRLRAERLAKARSAITDPRLATQTISIIAYNAGFSDISYFNRVFRTEFGMSPREMRRSGLPA